MVTLQDRILLLFDDAHPAMVCTGIARVLGVPHEDVQDELRHMVRKGLVQSMEHRGKIGVTITPEGEGARDIFVTTFVNKSNHEPKAVFRPGSVRFSI